MNQVSACVKIIREKSLGLYPQIGLILGSGLSSFADQVNISSEISFNELPGFPQAGVGGHVGKLLLGRVGNTKVAILQGRSHYYEEGKADTMAVAIKTLKEIGCDSLVLTNAAGSIKKGAKPGDIMLITDHINMTGVSPLFGSKGNDRFVDMCEAYDPDLSERMRKAANKNGVNLNEGVYAWWSGPQFETPAEIRALKILGADAVGMSTVPEVIVARHAKIPLCALSVLTNYAAGISDTPLSHEQTIRVAKLAEKSIKDILNSYLNSFSNDNN
ncbi:MAG: purine-nucleoside phosphorylase [Bacteroidetes bacterium]|nr:MAG: purine-nucleoside phosphorylase [Bacteroidota bacterium]